MFDSPPHNAPYDTSFKVFLPNGEAEVLNAQIKNALPYLGSSTMATAFIPTTLLDWSNPPQLQRHGFTRDQETDQWTINRVGENESHALDLLRRDIETFLNLQNH